MNLTLFPKIVFVLILIVVEDSLVQAGPEFTQDPETVLILIVVEDSLVPISLDCEPFASIES